MAIDYSVLGKRISALRRTQKRTQENLAEYLTVSVGYVSQIERGATRVNLDTLSNIAAYLGCETAQLLSGVETQAPHYLDEELFALYAKLEARQKKMLLEIARLFLAGNPNR